LIFFSDWHDDSRRISCFDKTGNFRYEYLDSELYCYIDYKDGVDGKWIKHDLIK
ncbi:unnamed protein product, partial [marine sediment metagenome]